ncbi:hypothetical protein ACLB2K_040961 [Fragaria x ananassa]
MYTQQKLLGAPSLPSRVLGSSFQAPELGRLLPTLLSSQSLHPVFPSSRALGASSLPSRVLGSSSQAPKLWRLLSTLLSSQSLLPSSHALAPPPYPPKLRKPPFELPAPPPGPPEFLEPPPKFPSSNASSLASQAPNHPSLVTSKHKWDDEMVRKGMKPT